MLRVLAGLMLVVSSVLVPAESGTASAENWQPVAGAGECVDIASIKTKGKFTSWRQGTGVSRVNDAGRPYETCPLLPQQSSSREVDCTQNLTATFDQYGFDEKTGQGTEFSQTVQAGDTAAQYLRDIANYVCKIAMAKSPTLVSNWQKVPGTELCVDTNSETIIDGMLQWSAAICNKGSLPHDQALARVYCGHAATGLQTTLRTGAPGRTFEADSIDWRTQGAAMARFACEHGPGS